MMHKHEMVEEKMVVDSLQSTTSYETTSSEELEGGHVDVRIDPPGVRFSWRTFMQYAGPGWLMSLAAIDPGNLEANLQAGAYTGYQLLWALLLSIIMALVMQTLAIRVGTVTGLNLAQLARKSYPFPVAIFMWIVTEIGIICADVQEVLGTAIALKMLLGLPLWSGALITGLDTLTFLLVHRFGVQWLEMAIFFLIFVTCTCFFATFFAAHPPIGEIMHGTFVPSLENYAVSIFVALFGATLPPHNFYLHSGMVQSRRIDRDNPVAVRQANKYFVIDAARALILAFLINLAVIAVFAHGFYSPQCAKLEPGNPMGLLTVGNVKKCAELGLEMAGQALEKVFGPAAQYLFAFGLLAAGQSSTVVGTFAGQFIMEGFINVKLAVWKRVMITRSLALVPAVIVCVLADTFPMINTELQQILNIAQTVVLPFALLPGLHFNALKKYMGENTIHPVLLGVCWVLSLALIGTNYYMLATIADQMAGGNGRSLWWIMYGVFCVLYTLIQIVLVQEDITIALRWLYSRILCWKSPSDEPMELESQGSVVQCSAVPSCVVNTVSVGSDPGICCSKPQTVVVLISNP